MFSNKTNNPPVNPSSSQGPFGGSLNLPQEENNSAPENLSVHTMKDDLKNINNFEAVEKPIQSAPRRVEIERIKSPVNSVSEKTTSPFLTPEKTEIKNITGEKSLPEAKKERLEMPEPQDHPGLGRVITFAVIIAVTVVVIFSGYYFWATRAVKTPVVTEEVSSVKPENAIVPEEPALPTFLENKANYLVLDMSVFDAVAVKKTLQEYASEVYKSKVVFPVEFIVVDENNNPVLFTDFAKKLDLAFSEGIFSQLGQDFSLFIYIDNGKVGMGLAASSKNDALLKSALAQNEKNLVRQLAPFFPVEANVLQDAVFKSSEYDGKTIRYSNIKSAEELSVDYTVFGGKLFVGTTKMTLRSILDQASENIEIK